MSLAPYRIAQAPEPEAPEDDDAPFVARLRRQARKTQLVGLGIVLVLGVGAYASLTRHGPSAASRWAEAAREQELARTAWIHEALAGADLRAHTAQKHFEDGLRSAVANDTGDRASTDTCPIALPRATGIVRGRSAFPLVFASRKDVEDGFVTSPTVRVIRADIDAAVRNDAAGRSEEAALYARALERVERYRFDVVLVTEKKKDPVVTSTTSYEPGEASGRVYVYDFATERIVCRGDVQAASSKELGYAYASEPDAPRALERRASLEATLDADFRWQIERSIVATSLHAL